MASGTGDGRAEGCGQGPCSAVQGTGTEISSGGLKMVTNASPRFLRPSLIATVVLAAAMTLAPRAAQARGSSGHGGGGGHSGGSSHSGGASRSSGGSRVSSSHGSSSHGGGWHGGGHRRGGSGYYPYGWGWGWDPFYSSWWWGDPSVYVVTGGDGEGDGSLGEAEEEAPPAPRAVPQRAPRADGWNDRERVPEERMDARPEPLPRSAGNRARMRFKVTPEDAAVYIDDKYLGAGEDLAGNPRGVVTDPGTHTITIARPGYKTKTVNITVRIGAPVDVVVKLEK
jgi:hypothetical protein